MIPHLPTPEALHDELKKLIVETLALEGITPSGIATDAPLFVEGLGLDSIDALELATVLEERYGVTLGEDPDENRETFYSVRTLAAFSLERRPQGTRTAGCWWTRRTQAHRFHSAGTPRRARIACTTGVGFEHRSLASAIGSRSTRRVPGCCSPRTRTRSPSVCWLSGTRVATRSPPRTTSPPRSARWSAAPSG